jgi:hypothetical protein
MEQVIQINTNNKNRYELLKYYFEIIKNKNLETQTKQKIINDKNIDNSYLTKIVSKNVISSCEILRAYCKKFKIDELKQIEKSLKNIIINLRNINIYMQLPINFLIY